jgi:hypothetical protein
VRLDHLLSKEHLQIIRPVYAGLGVCQEYMPVAQTQVLRRVLKGGISTDRCLVARAGCEYGCFLFLRGGWCSGKRAGAGCWVVFGTLLGPEATGPGICFSGTCLFLVSWLHRSCV